MKNTLKELYGVGILFFYFFKWPFFLGFIYMYNNGLNQNYILIALWFYSLLLILKDFYILILKKSHKE
jgi:Sec-independent protein secretion pathway component TatC